MKKIDRTGEISYNTFCSKIILVKYRNEKDKNVYFQEYN